MTLHATGSVPVGFDTVIFTATRPSQVAKCLVDQILIKWPNALIEIEVNGVILQQFQLCTDYRSIIDIIQGDHATMTAVKDEVMAAFFHENSYESMPNGEGAISYHIRKRHNVVFELPRLNGS